MNKSLLLFLFFNLFLIKLSAQINLKGEVYFDNKPKRNVTVYLNNTTAGNITDKTVNELERHRKSENDTDAFILV